MRATCEHCARLQPPEWVAGDQCVHCGDAVRHELRCCWCATWTPDGAYCRTCGAEVVDEHLYPAARMLKDAGVDRFSIAAQLASMDPAQVENFTRIYQRHASVAARHVEQLSVVQRHLRHHGWVGTVDDQLAAELPWPADQLQRYDTAPLDLDFGTPASVLATIETTTPLEITRSLAPIARLRLNDWEAFAAASASLASSDPDVRDEAALALTSWRVHTVGLGGDDPPALAEALGASAFTFEAAIRLASFRRDGTVDLPPTPAALDRETTIGLALVTGDVDVLRATLDGDDIERCAAGAALIRLGALAGLDRVLDDGPDAVRIHLVQELGRVRESVPELTDALLGIIESTSDPRLREMAVRVAGPALGGEQARRVARAAARDRRVLQSLLERIDLPADAVADLLDWMIDAGVFAGAMPGMATVVEAGRVPLAFVPQRFSDAPTALQLELLPLAELQLDRAAAQPDDVESLHRFLVGALFADVATDVRTATWWVLHRWYQHQGDHRGSGPLRLEPESVERYFGPAVELITGLTRVVGDGEALDEVGFADFAADLFASADPAWIAEVQASHHDGHELVRALIDGVAVDHRSNVNESMIVLLAQLATIEPWRVDALAAVRDAGRAGNFHVDRAIRRLVLAEHGIPTEDAWAALALDFVPTRFSGVSANGQLEMLAVAEQQLIHTASSPPWSALLAFVGRVGDGSFSTEVRERAAELHRQRAPYGNPGLDRPGT